MVVTRYVLKHYLLALLLLVLTLPVALSYEQLEVSGIPYHPDSSQRIVFYTDMASAEGLLISPSNVEQIVIFESPKDAFGNTVDCQGGIPCLVAVLDLDEEGTYSLSVVGAEDTHSVDFVVSSNAYDDVSIFSEFFMATKMQDSPYHADYYVNYEPIFPYMADGSFIMEANQASTTLIRLGSAYRRNPDLLAFDEYIVAPELGSGNPDIAEHIYLYAEYLKALQGAQVIEVESGFRLNPAMKITYAFVPGVTSLESLDVYIPGSTPQYLETVSVQSLCNSDTECLADAATLYKCQENEPCLNMEYIEAQGALVPANHYDVLRGWGYEFGCFNDIDFTQEGLEPYNPCNIFYDDTSREQTSMALLAFTQAIPALHDLDPDLAEEYLVRAEATANYIEDTYAFGNGDSDVGFYAAALLLLYDYTGDAVYLERAHELRTFVPIVFISDNTRAPEFYWEEYVRHKDAFLANDLEYSVSGTNPEEFFRGKMFFDYKDRGPTAISKNGELVFQFDNNIRFQNSRFMLTESVIAAKTATMYGGAEPFMLDIANAQISWLTGMNAVQKGVALDSPLGSQSFIFGIGEYPEQYHSRLLIDTSHTQNSAGAVVGARATGLQWFNGTEYLYLDGRFSILGTTLGSLGNGNSDEEQIKPFVQSTFNNGLDYIPGWINGAFDISEDQDVIFNYDDDMNTYEFTETTNEMVATAIEAWAYLDGFYNERDMHPLAIINTTNSSNDNAANSTGNNTGTNSSDVCSLAIVPVFCSGNILSDIYVNSSANNSVSYREVFCEDVGSGLVTKVTAGEYSPSAIDVQVENASTTLGLCFGDVCVIPTELVQSGALNCSATEPRWNFSTNSSDSNSTNSTNTTATCGNAIIEDGEFCDDGNAQNGDGCSSVCLVEPVYVYTDGSLSSNQTANLSLQMIGESPVLLSYNASATVSVLSLIVRSEGVVIIEVYDDSRSDILAQYFTDACIPYAIVSNTSSLGNLIPQTYTVCSSDSGSGGSGGSGGGGGRGGGGYIPPRVDETADEENISSSMDAGNDDGSSDVNAGEEIIILEDVAGEDVVNISGTGDVLVGADGNQSANESSSGNLLTGAFLGEGSSALGWSLLVILALLVLSALWVVMRQNNRL